MLLIEESDHYCLYSDTEKDELLFRLFRHLCLGGQICQYEDTVEPYLAFTKQLYKDLIRYWHVHELKWLNKCQLGMNYDFVALETYLINLSYP